MIPFRVYTQIESVKPKPRVVVLGNFDGLHLGHQALIHKGKQIANNKGLPLMVFTFFPQYHSVKDPNFKYLLSQFDKMKMLESLGVNEVLTLPFDKWISSMSAEDFLETILRQTLRTQDIVVGFNFTFGHKASGNVQYLETHGQGMGIHVVEPVKTDGDPVSSTTIRRYLAEGRIDEADCLLGYPYHLCGEVVHGQAIGRTIDFPTANIDYDDRLLLPALGVYSAVVWLTRQPEEKWYGVLNIGTRPTIDNSPSIIVEVHILDFDDDIYGQDLCIEVHHFLRKIVKFEGLDSLKEAIEGDVINTRAFFSEETRCD